ncbi:MAG: hypothetical protein KDE27_07410 [Planctomycetes bacterium]|nr:hypothetical protein [Planctomycetota bacterium]
MRYPHPIPLLMFLTGTALTAQQVVSDSAPSVVIARHADGAIAACSPRFSARFDTEAVTIAALATEAPAVLGLRYVAATRGTFAAADDRQPPPQRDGHRIEFVRGDIVERYEVTESGFEQSFTIASRPAGAGDLVLTIATSGNVRAAARDAAHGELTFTAANGSAIRYGAAIAFDRGRTHRVDVLTEYDGAGELRLRVPADFVDRARYPIVVDPAVGPVLTVAETTGASPAISRDTERDQYCVTWVEAETVGAEDIQSKLLVQMFRDDGTAIGSSVVIDSYTTAVSNLGWLRLPAIAYCKAVDGDAHLVVYMRDNRVYGQLVRATTGAAIGTRFLISGVGFAGGYPAVSGPGIGPMMVAWCRRFGNEEQYRQVIVRSVHWPESPTSPVLGPEQVLDAVVPPMHVINPTLASSSIQIGAGPQGWHRNRAFWQRFRSQGESETADYDIHTASFEMRTSPPAFAFLDGPRATLDAAQVGVEDERPHVTCRAPQHLDPEIHEYYVVWTIFGRILGQRFDSYRELGPPRTIDFGPFPNPRPRVAAGSSEFTVVYNDGEGSASSSSASVYGARVLFDGTVAIRRRPILASSSFNPFAAVLTEIDLSQRPILDAPAQLDNRSLVTLCLWGSITMRLFDNVGGEVGTYGTACPGPAAELPAIGSSGPMYPGSTSFVVTLDDAPPNAVAVLVMDDSFASTPIPGAPGCWSYTGAKPIESFFTMTDAAGSAAVALPIPHDMPHGSGRSLQWLVMTPGFNDAGGIVSNGLELYFSHF